jgi:hypothetical protein
MSTKWKFAAPKVALLFVTGLCTGYWVGRSVGAPEWMTLEIVLSVGVALVVLVTCRRKVPSVNGEVYGKPSRFFQGWGS